MRISLPTVFLATAVLSTSALETTSIAVTSVSTSIVASATPIDTPDSTVDPATEPTNTQPPGNEFAGKLGINCRGSGNCRKNQAPARLNDFIKNITPCRRYRNGEHIACINAPNVLDRKGGYCAFLQGTTDGMSGVGISALAQAIVDHGCDGCGSVPIAFVGPDKLQSHNDPDAGILTINFVSSTDNPCPDGLC